MPSRFVMAAVCVSAMGWTAFASAQGPSLRPSRQPAVSPYTNLLNRNNSLVQNYYNRVRPELEFRAADASFSQSLQGVQSRLDDQEAALRNSSLGTTGHGTAFMSYGSYYRLGAGGGSRSGGGGGAGRGARGR